MNNQRARDILSSPDMINVTYNGAQVYIETINEVNNTATIHFLNQPENKQEVSLNNLIEQ
ncbi:H-type small acid-soluble spore protein [Mycoplasmatota bacterium WC44]